MSVDHAARAENVAWMAATGCIECGTPVKARQRCSTHYYRWYKAAGGPFRRTVLERLMERVEMPNGRGGCWVWTGAKSGRDADSGYGKINLNKRYVPTHRAMYELLMGPIPDGLELDHLCRNPPCCNPAHLEPVTPAENMRRARLDSCKRGHAYTKENTYRSPGRPGARQCRECRRLSEKRRSRA